MAVPIFLGQVALVLPLCPHLPNLKSKLDNQADYSLNTFHPNASWGEFYDHCAPCPDGGLEDWRLIASLRAFDVGVGSRKSIITFADVKENISKGFPILTVINCPGEDGVAHWIVIYAYSEDSKGKNKKVYLANNSFKGIHHPALANSVMPFHRFQKLSRAFNWYVCWGK